MLHIPLLQAWKSIWLKLYVPPDDHQYYGCELDLFHKVCRGDRDDTLGQCKHKTVLVERCQPFYRDASHVGNWW